MVTTKPSSQKVRSGRDSEGRVGRGGAAAAAGAPPPFPSLPCRCGAHSIGGAARRSNERTVIASVQSDIELVSTNNDETITDEFLPPIKHYKRGGKRRRQEKTRRYGSKTTRTRGALSQSRT